MRTIIVTAGVIIQKGKILITRRKEGVPHALLWEFPGGKVKEGEEPRQALQRELKEELGVEAEVERIVEIVFHFHPDHPILLLLYSCRIGRGDPMPIDCYDLQWVTPEELKNREMPPADGPIQERLGRYE